MGTRYNHLGKAVLTSTHNLCIGAKIRKIGIPLQTLAFLYKIQGVFITWTSLRDGNPVTVAHRSSYHGNYGISLSRIVRKPDF